MNFASVSSKRVSRRALFKFAGYAAAAGVVVSPRLAFAGGCTIDVTAAPFSASPNNADNSAAFQAALNVIAGNGGGRLYVPGGRYALASPLNYKGGSITVFGDGQDSTVLVNTHSGTVLTSTFGSSDNCLTVKDLGFSPCSGSQAHGAIAVVLPAGPSGWQNVEIENVCIGVPYFTSAGQYTSYSYALSLTNTNRARINNLNVHANGITGGYAVALQGTCYDTRIIGSSLEGYSVGVAVLAYCEGLHLANNVIICDTAVSTGTQNYNPGVFAINLLELFMSDCEINTTSECLYLYQVKTAQISNCHFTGPKSPTGGMVSAIDMRGCSESLVENCTFCGSWAPGSQQTVGIALNPSTRVSTSTVNISNVIFENTTIGIFFGAGANSNTASNVQMLQYNCGGLVNGSVTNQGQQQMVALDGSNNSSNNASWLTSANTFTAVTSRRVGTLR
jgi:hypothetical protein